MRPRTLDRTTQVFCLLSLVAAMSAESATLLSDGFETYSNGTQLISGTNGWGASDAAVVVQNATAFEGAQAALISPGSFASNGVAAGSNVTNLWVEVLARRVVVPAPVAGPPAVDTNAAVMVYLDTNSNLVAYNPDPAVTNWVTITNDYWNTNLTAFCTGQWARISLDQNYQTKKAAIFVEGHLIREQWPFINTNLSASGVRRFRMDSGVCVTSYVDNATASLNVPSALTNYDLDHDGIADAEEIQSYGRLSIWGATVSNTISMAAPAVIFNGNLAVTGGVTLTVAASSLTVTGTVTLAGGSIIVVTNGSLAASSLMIGVGATVQVFNASIAANGITRTGTFTLDSTWGSVSMIPSRLNFADDYEAYAGGLSFQMLGAFGWATPDASVAVQTGVGVANSQDASTRAAVLPAVTELTNVLDTAQTASLTNIWTDCFIRGTDFMPPDWALHVDTAATAIVFFNTSTQMVVRDNGQWDICSNDVVGVSASSVYTGGWARVTLNQNYTRKDVAVFLNGRLMRQHVPFVNTNQVKASAFLFNSGRTAPAYLDNVNILTNVPPDLDSPSYDSDHDGIPDAVEIARYGDLSAMPRGSVFKIR